MPFRFGQRSLDRLKGVHPHLVQVMSAAIVKSAIDFTVLEGLRTPERQRHLVAQGASRTLRSRHLTGHAVDVAPLIDGQVRWDWPLYNRLSTIIKQAAAELSVPIEWGGDWRTFRDGPHWQLPFSKYPR